MREYCRQSQAEVARNNRNKAHQSWGPAFNQALWSVDAWSVCEFVHQAMSVLLSLPSARKQILFVNKFRSSEPAEGRMESRTSLPAGSKF